MKIVKTHERQFAYEAHTACDKHGFVLGVEVTAGNIRDSVAWDALYAQVIERFPQAEYSTMDAAYKPWDFTYDECFICPQGCRLRHTAISKDGKRCYRSYSSLGVNAAFFDRQRPP